MFWFVPAFFAHNCKIFSLGSQFNPIQLDDDGGDRNDPNYQWQEGCGPMLPYEGPLEVWEQWPSDWPKESVTAEEWEAIPEGLLNQNTKSEEWEPIPPEVGVFVYSSHALSLWLIFLIVQKLLSAGDRKRERRMGEDSSRNTETC